MNILNIDLSTQTNPDATALQNRRVVDISLSTADVSASLASGSLSIGKFKPNYSQQKTVLTVSTAPSTTDSSIYYFPMYREKINYEGWKKTVDKTFSELGV